MSLVNGDYRIHSCYNKTGERKHVLNLDKGKTTNGTRIYTTEPNGTCEQIWLYSKNRLYTEAQDSIYREKKCLDRLDTSANYADIFDNNDAVNQLLTIEPVSEKQNIYRIKLINKKLYLTTSTITGIGSCTWQPLDKNSEKQKWVFERVIRVTEMPKISAYAKEIEYFSGCTRWKDGSFDRQDRDIKELVKKLYLAVSNKNGKDNVLIDRYCLYNLPGSLIGKKGDLSGYYHYGIEISFSGNVYPYKDGTFFGERASDGAVGIKHSFPQGDFVFWYLHMTNRFTAEKDKPVSRCTCIGEAGGQKTAGKYLHIEVQPLDEAFPRSPIDNRVYINEDDKGYFGAFDLLDFIA